MTTTKLRKNEKIKHIHVTQLRAPWGTPFVIHAFTNEGRVLQRYPGEEVWTDKTPERDDA